MVNTTISWLKAVQVLFGINVVVWLAFGIVGIIRLADILPGQIVVWVIAGAVIFGNVGATVGVEHVYSFVIGDGVPHVHVHVIGRYPGTPREYWGPEVDEWPDAPKGGTAEIETVTVRMRAFLSER